MLDPGPPRLHAGQPAGNDDCNSDGRDSIRATGREDSGRPLASAAGIASIEAETIEKEG